MELLITIAATVVVLGVLIFVHELGHFVTAKLADIEVPRFSIGFGPRIIGFKRGETEYVISALPLGGYVKMAGMEEMEHIEGGPATVNDTVGAETEQELEQIGERPHRPRDFESKSLPARALVISAGVIMNFLFAIIVFAILAAVKGVPADPGTTLGGVAEDSLTAGAAPLAGIRPGMKVTAVNGESVATMRDLQNRLVSARPGDARLSFENAPDLTFELPSDGDEKQRVISSLEPAFPFVPIMGTIVPGDPADEAGLESGDRVLEAAGQPVATWAEFVTILERSGGVAVPLVVDRNGERVQLTVTPEARALDSGLTVGRIGAGLMQNQPDVLALMPRSNPGLLGAIRYGASETWGMTALTADFLAGMVTGRHSARNIGGPIMIGQMSGQFARAGIEQFLSFMAILSVNLAVLNLLPIPVLDGGHLVFLAAEGIRGRPLSIEARMRATQVGFVFIILLMTWAIGNDLLRVIGF